MKHFTEDNGEGYVKDLIQEHEGYSLGALIWAMVAIVGILTMGAIFALAIVGG